MNNEIKNFSFYREIEIDEICNMESEISSLKKSIDEKRQVVIYGRRNVGKTSIVKNVIIPYFQKKNKESFVLFCDFLKVDNVENCAYRLRLGFQEGFRRSFPKKNKLIEMAESLKRLRPMIQIDPIEGPSLTVTATAGKEPTIEDFFLKYNKFLRDTLCC